MEYSGLLDNSDNGINVCGLWTLICRIKTENPSQLKDITGFIVSRSNSLRISQLLNSSLFEKDL